MLCRIAFVSLAGGLHDFIRPGARQRGHAAELHRAGQATAARTLVIGEF